eukprot:6475184-Amphidinium_carterae.1
MVELCTGHVSLSCLKRSDGYYSFPGPIDGKKPSIGAFGAEKEDGGGTVRKRALEGRSTETSQGGRCLACSTV